ncbi:MAG: hypothetical protein ABW084_12525 [Candidatus Thiodiazotropha sp.]
MTDEVHDEQENQSNEESEFGIADLISSIFISYGAEGTEEDKSHASDNIRKYLVQSAR